MWQSWCACAFCILILTIIESSTRVKKPMRGKSKCPIMFRPNWDLQGKKKINRGFKHRQQQHQWQRQKSNRFNNYEVKQQLCMCIMLFVQFSLPLHANKVKRPNETFCGGCKRKTTASFFFLWTEIQLL